MKKWLSLLLVFAMLIAMPASLALGETDETDLIVADGAEDDGDETEWLYEDDELDSEDLDAEDIDEDDLAVADDGEPIVTVDEEDQEDLLAAMQVYSWFALQPLDVDLDQPNDDDTKWLVLDERYNTKELMIAMLKTYFSDEIVDELWNSAINPYTEIDGFLYTDGEGREIDERIGETEIEVTKKTEKTIQLTATVYYDETEDEDDATKETFEYERKLIDGKWRYTLFPFFW